jgi:hypothetical protein
LHDELQVIPVYFVTISSFPEAQIHTMCKPNLYQSVPVKSADQNYLSVSGIAVRITQTNLDDFSCVIDLSEYVKPEFSNVAVETAVSAATDCLRRIAGDLHASHVTIEIEGFPGKREAHWKQMSGKYESVVWPSCVGEGPSN